MPNTLWRVSLERLDEIKFSYSSPSFMLALSNGFKLIRHMAPEYDNYESMMYRLAVYEIELEGDEIATEKVVRRIIFIPLTPEDVA